MNLSKINPNTVVDVYPLVLKGSKGGKGSGGSANKYREDPETLQAKSTAYLLELVSCATIRGPVDGEKSIYLDRTPLQNSDGSRNFTGVEYAFRNGSPNQSVIPGFETIRSEYSVGVDVTKQTSVTRRISSPEASAIIVRVGFPSGMSRQQTDASDPALVGTSVTVLIQVSANGGPFINYLSPTISGKTSSPYVRSFRIELPSADFWDVRVSRVTDDSTTATLNNKTRWDAYTIVSGAKLNYPGSALMAYTVDAQSFGSTLPSRWVDMYGIYVQIPTNYDPVTRTYSGFWDGTFKLGWTNNPAWFLWWLITDTENGVGESLPEEAATFSIAELYAISKYCDEMVNDGHGGLEPRFTFNAWIVDRQKAFDYLRLICGSFRTMVFWGGDSVVFSQDRPRPISRIFTSANVIGGDFTYSETALSTKYSYAEVSWHDPDDFCRASTLVVEDADLIHKIGLKPYRMSLLGCTSRGQAARAGHYALYLESGLVKFSIGLAEADIEPGQVIGIADSKYAGVSFAGRLHSVENKVVQLDREYNFLPGQNYKIHLTMINNAMDTVDIINPERNTDKISLTRDPVDKVLSGSLWSLTSSQIAPRTFRVISIAENGPLEFEVVALQFSPEKFDLIEKGLKFDPPPTSLIPTGALPPPLRMDIAEYLYASGTEVKSGFVLSWEQPSPMDSRINYYEIQIKSPRDDTFQGYGLIPSVSVDVKDTIAGFYTFRVRSVSGLGFTSRWIEFSQLLYALEMPLPNVMRLTSFFISDRMNLAWDAVEDIRSFEYEIRRGLSWDVGQLEARTTNLLWAVPRDGLYWIKAVFRAAQSPTAAAIEVEGASGLVQNVIAVLDEDSQFWPGTKNGLVLTDDNRLVLSSDQDFYAGTDFYAGKNFYFDGIPRKLGIYEIEEKRAVSLDANASCNITIDLEGYAVSINQDFYAGTDFYAGENFYGNVGNGWRIYPQLKVRKNGFWGDWENFNTGQYIGDGFSFRAIVERTTVDIPIYLTNFHIEIDVPDRRQSFNNLNIPIDGLTVEFNPPFNAPPTLVATILNATGSEDVIIDPSHVSRHNAFVQVLERPMQAQDKDNKKYIQKHINLIAEGY